MTRIMHDEKQTQNLSIIVSMPFKISTFKSVFLKKMLDIDAN